MTGRKTLLLLATTAACFVPFAAGAEDQPLSTRAILERGYQNRPDLSYSSEVEAGVGYNSVDSFKFGEYTGLTDEGVFAVGNVDVIQRAPFDGESTQYWEVTGTDLGLDSRSVHLGYGQQGTFDVFFDYDQIPHNQIDDARTPYRGTGGSVLTLPSGWTRADSTELMPDLRPSLKNVEIETERKDLGGGITWHLSPNWSVSGTYHHQFKDGTDTIAGLFGTNGGNPRAAILPEPIDYETDTANFNVAYTGMRSQLELAYEGSWFTNNNDSLTWDNAFTNPPGFRAWDDEPDRGRLALPPDNQAHRISLSGGYNLTDTTRLTGVFSYARMTQDEDFLPYTINPNLSVPVALPRKSLDGEVNNILANVAVTARPMPKLELAARYRYNDRDNDTPRDIFLHTANDVGDQVAASADDARINLPYGWTQHLVNLDAGYRILPSTKVSLGYEFENKDRTFTVVETTRDHTFKGRVQSAPLDYLNGHIAYAHTIRDGSDYAGNRPFLDSHANISDPADFENHPFLRKFYLTDRNTDNFNAGISVMPSEQVTLGLSGGYTFNDYDDPVFGLDTSTMGHVTVDVGFSPREDVTAYAFFTHERNTYKQRGYSFNSSPANAALPVDPSRLWSIDTDDQVETLGGRVEWAAIPDMLDLAAEYTYSTAATHFSFTDGSPPVLPVPEIKTRVHSLGVTADYHLDTNMSLKFGYRYEVFNSEDFALDGVEPDTIGQVITLGEDSPDYVAHIFAVSLKYKF